MASSSPPNPSSTGAVVSSELSSITRYDGSELPDSVVNVVIDDALSRIPHEAFEDQAELQTVQLGKSIRAIGDTAFYGCAQLHHLDFHRAPRLKSIGGSAFCTCAALEQVSLPSSLTILGRNSFSDCGALVNVELPPDLTVIRERTFERCRRLQHLALPINLQAVNDGAFLYCCSLTRLSIPASVIYIHNSSFRCCFAIEHIEFQTHPHNQQSSLVRIGIQSFRNCRALKQINIPNSIREIGSLAFEGCDSLETVQMPCGPHTINFENDIFVKCPKLSQIIVPHVSHQTAIWPRYLRLFQDRQFFARMGVPPLNRQTCVYSFLREHARRLVEQARVTMTRKRDSTRQGERLHAAR